MGIVLGVSKLVENRRKAARPTTATAADVENATAENTNDVESSASARHGERSDEAKGNRLGAIDVQPQHGKRNKEYELAETRAVSRKYVFQRPRALQYAYHGHVVTAGDEESAFAVSQSLSRQTSSESEGMLPIKEYAFLGVEKLRERLDLFIDLIWVGIITNLSEVFSSYYFDPEARSGTATLIFLITFIASWRIWNMMREFLGNYYQDDLAQRIFIFWILVLSVFYGNNLAYLTEKLEEVKTIVITLYLCIRGSFALMESAYSIFIPWLRRLMLVSFLLLLPSAGLWIAAIYVEGVNAAGPIIVAIAWEYTVPIILESSFADRLTPSDYRKAIDPHHFTSRFASFFVIIVGEGVLQLIARGPLGIGISGTAGVSVWGLSLYFILAFLYFNRDMSKTVVPAVRRKGWRVVAWVFCHIPIFASFLTLSAAVMFLLRDIAQFAYNQSEESQELPEQDIPYFQQSAIWCIAVSLAIILLAMSVMALLDKPLDPPGTLVINNRYVRLSARFVYIVVILCVPIKESLNPTLFLGIAGILLLLVNAWEWWASLEANGIGLFEPRSLAVMVAKDKQKRTNKNGSTSMFHGLVGLGSHSSEPK